jgi:hypothetical protein
VPSIKLRIAIILLGKILLGKPFLMSAPEKNSMSGLLDDGIGHLHRSF